MTKVEPPSSYTLHQHDQDHKRQPTLLDNFNTKWIYTPLILSALSLAALPQARRHTFGYPSVMQCNFYAGIFGCAAYALASGDTMNGPGLTASWSAIWLFFNGRKALTSGRPLPVVMSLAVASIGSIYGYNYATIGM